MTAKQYPGSNLVAKIVFFEQNLLVCMRASVNTITIETF